MTPGRTTRRWIPVLALVAIATMVNYLDRTVLGIAAPYLTKELGLTAEQSARIDKIWETARPELRQEWDELSKLEGKPAQPSS